MHLKSTFVLSTLMLFTPTMREDVLDSYQHHLYRIAIKTRSNYDPVGSGIHKHRKSWHASPTAKESNISTIN